MADTGLELRRNILSTAPSASLASDVPGPEIGFPRNRELEETIFSRGSRRLVDQELQRWRRFCGLVELAD